MIRHAFALILFVIVCVLPVRAQWQKSFTTPYGAGFRHVTAVTRVGEWYICSTEGAGMWRTRDLMAEPWVRATENIDSALIFNVVSTGTRAWAVTLFGLWVSDDAGDTWTKTEPFPAAALMTLTTRHDTLWISNPTYGLFRTTDEGQTWTEHYERSGLGLQYMNYITIGPGVLGALTVNPTFTSFGVLYSSNNGESWILRTDSLFPPRSNLLYFLEDGTCRVNSFEGSQDVPYVHESTDGCVTFRRSSNTLGERVTAWTTRGMGLLFGTAEGGLKASPDGGDTYLPFNDGYTMEQVMFVDVVGDELLATNDQGDVFVRPVGEWDAVTSVRGESVRGARCAGCGERRVRGSVPYTRVAVEHSSIIDVYDVMGRHERSMVVEPGTHVIDTPWPCIVVVRE